MQCRHFDGRDHQLYEIATATLRWLRDDLSAGWLRSPRRAGALLAMTIWMVEPSSRWPYTSSLRAFEEGVAVCEIATSC